MGTPEDSTKLEAMRVVMMLVALLGMLAPAMAFVAAAPMRVQSRSATPVMGNNAPEGPFTPIVLAGKVVLGEKLFNKIRGKGISIHSQVITEFCEDFGVPTKMRGALIKKAKNTGGILGFLN